MDFPRNKVRYTATAIWALLIALGMSAMDRYENTPGQFSPTPKTWPSACKLTLSPDRLTLIVFVHPQCPCTRATIAELSQLLARHQNRIQATLVAIIPARLKQWSRSSLLIDAAAVPNLQIQTDIDGKEAKRFGALASGFTVAYAPDSALRFAGGITPARGEAGDSFGLNTLEELANIGAASLSTTPVFGCDLFSKRARAGAR
jgi:hypothetical protein